jgi:hypothetical protein
MGGELTLESVLGQGSPSVLPSPARRCRLAVPRRSGRVLGLAPGQPACRVLVAEDHPDNRELIRRLLEGVGFEVRWSNRASRRWSCLRPGGRT